MRSFPLPFLYEEEPQAEPEPLYQYVYIPTPQIPRTMVDDLDETPHIIIIDLNEDF